MSGTPDGTDSAGVPWAGRTLTAQPFAGDTGQADARLARAMAAAAGGADPAFVPVDRLRAEAEVVAALAGTRLLVPVVAVLTEPAAPPGPDEPDDANGPDDPNDRNDPNHPDDPAGRLRRAAEGDKSADMALPLRTRADGVRVLPAFTSTAALAAWDAGARPVAVEAERAALAAVAEGCEQIVLDEAGPVPFPVRRPALWALAQGRPWVPSPHDPDVVAAVAAACAGPAVLEGTRCEPGTRAEMRVVLGVRPGLDRRELDALLAGVRARLAADEVVAERVDSLELRVLPA